MVLRWHFSLIASFILWLCVVEIGIWLLSLYIETDLMWTSYLTLMFITTHHIGIHFIYSFLFHLFIVNILSHKMYLLLSPFLTFHIISFQLLVSYFFDSFPSSSSFLPHMMNILTLFFLTYCDNIINISKSNWKQRKRRRWRRKSTP